MASSQFGDCWACKQLWGYLRPQRWGCRIGVSDPRVRFYVYGVCIELLYSIAYRCVTQGAVLHPMLPRRGVLRESVYAELQMLLGGLSSGAEGGGTARGLFG